MGSCPVFRPQFLTVLKLAAIYTGVALTTMATLVLELSLTASFLWFSTIISRSWQSPLRLFGLGAGGVFSYVVGPVGINVSKIRVFGGCCQHRHGTVASDDSDPKRVHQRDTRPDLLHKRFPFRLPELLFQL